MSVVAMIPARGGSKRVPGKNTADCAGRPLLAWTAEAALGSTAVDRTILSTDDEHIAAVGRDLGLEVPFLRPAELSNDAAPMGPVMQHLLSWLTETGDSVEALVLLQPSSPLRQARHIDEALQIFFDGDAETVVSVVEVPHAFHPTKLLRIEDGRVAPYHEDAARQVAPAFGRNGPAILINHPSVIARGERWGNPILPYVMTPELSVDIDEPFDLELAAFLLEKRRRGKAAARG